MKSHTISIAFLGIALLILAGAFIFKPVGVDGAAFTGQPAFLQIATSTIMQSGVAKTIATSTAQCNSRIITVGGASSLMLVFGDTSNGDLSSTTLTGTVGHWQAASTTVAYDSGLYGCGRVSARSYADVPVTISQF
jgi:hypothetical protein